MFHKRTHPLQDRLTPFRPSVRGLRAQVRSEDRIYWLDESRTVCDAIFDGLDVSGEIESVATQSLGETVLLQGTDRLEGLAVCHIGPATEAGSGTCYVKFGAVAPGPSARERLEQLLDACAAAGAARGATRLLAGVNAARREAYDVLLSRGFRIDFQGVAMHRPDEPGYSRPGAYVLDDWR